MVSVLYGKIDKIVISDQAHGKLLELLWVPWEKLGSQTSLL